jgi:hypothetical protein
VTEPTPAPVRRCAWVLDDSSRCPERAKAPGKRGPKPLHCQAHTIARTRAIKRSPANPRSSRPECCEGGIVCQQHRDARDEERKLKGWWYWNCTPRAEREAATLLEIMGISASEKGKINKGYSVTYGFPGDPKGWNTDAGPREGQTGHEWQATPWDFDRTKPRKRGEAPEYYDQEAGEFAGANLNWWK